MGSPRNPGNVVGNIGASLNRAVNDLGKGAQQIAKGDVERGLSNVVAGQANLYTYGMAEKIGVKGETGMEEDAKIAAEADAKDALDTANAKEGARKDAIRKRLDAEVSVRMKSPGRSQTLLTGMERGTQELVPGASATLLTTGRR
jgi:hypothetical protein